MFITITCLLTREDEGVPFMSWQTVVSVSWIMSTPYHRSDLCYLFCHLLFTYVRFFSLKDLLFSLGPCFYCTHESRLERVCVT
jgi:hypothetical protein